MVIVFGVVFRERTVEDPLLPPPNLQKAEIWGRKELAEILQYFRRKNRKDHFLNYEVFS